MPSKSAATNVGAYLSGGEGTRPGSACTLSPKVCRYAFGPPSTCTKLPLTQLEASDARKQAAPARS